jgi:hypothetical protein
MFSSNILAFACQAVLKKFFEEGLAAQASAAAGLRGFCGCGSIEILKPSAFKTAQARVPVLL